MRNYERIFLVILFFIAMTTFVLSNSLIFKEVEGTGALSPSPENAKVMYNLYFVDEDILKSEPRELPKSEESLTEALILKMMLGPKNGLYKGPFDEDDQLISIVKNRHNCTINLSEGFLNNGFWKEKNAELYIWSIVNTLTELDTVYDVNILVEGAPIKKLASGYDISGALSRIDDYMDHPKIYPSDIVLKFIEGVSSGRFDLSYGLLDRDSQSQFEFDTFIELFKSYPEKFGDYTKDLHFVQDHKSYWIVMIKYKPEMASRGVLFDTYKVVLEGSEMKINIIDRFTIKNKGDGEYE